MGNVTAAFREHMQAWPDQLTRTFDCVLRSLTAEESERVHAKGVDVTTRAYAVDPRDEHCAVLLVREGTFEGGHAVTLAVGRATDVRVPECFCDACDEESDDLIELADRIAELAAAGFHEFRRPHVPQPDDDPLYDPPWLEEGYETADGSGERHAGHNVTGEEFSVQWRPWPRR